MRVFPKFRSSRGNEALIVLKRQSDSLRAVDGQSGIALVIVMISIFVLSILAGGFAYSMKVETKLAQNANNETELLWLGRSGVEYARWVLAQQLNVPNEPYDALNQVWAGGQGGFGTTNSPLANVQREIQLGNGTFSWKITDLERKFNINMADETILQQAMSLTGADAGDFPTIVGSILDWIDPNDDLHIEGAENSYYESLDPPYEAKNGPMDDITELLFVRGVTPEIFWGSNSSNHPPARFQERLNRFGPAVQQPVATAGLVDLFSPLSVGRLNINTASATTLQLIPGVDQLIADAIVGAREGEDDGTGQTGPFRSLDPRYLWSRVPGISLEAARQIQRFGDIRSRTFQIDVHASIGNYQRDFVAVVGRVNQRDVQILSFSWK